MILAAVVALGVQGLHRSLWLDEAWVANSIRVFPLGEMFWGGEWLQTSPPLFLLSARAVVGVFGLSTEVLRAVPLGFALLAAVAMLAAARKVAPGWAAVAGAALLFPDVAVEYFGSFKQYGAEAAAVACVLWATVEYRRVGFGAYCALVAALLTLAYPLAFLLPGLLLWMRATEGPGRVGVFAAICAATLGGLYWVFIRPNVEPSLWQYWGRAEYGSGMWLWGAAVALLTARAVRTSRWLELACLLPCVLLVGAELSGWFPASPRMRLFIRPCFLLAAAMFLETVFSRRWLAVLGAAVAIATVATHRSEPFEDYPATVSYLREHVQSGDLLLVHPDAVQGLRLYSAMAGWVPPAAYANTGWPCCLRGRTPARSTEAAVRADLAKLIPADYRGKVWLFYANRPLHWDYIGLNEGELWRKLTWDRGCPPADYIALPNLVISPMQCVGRQP